MTFWIGVSLGFGVGGLFLVLIMFWFMAKALGEKSTTSDKLYQYWEVSMERQKEQVLILSDIAGSLAKEPTFYSVENDD